MHSFSVSELCSASKVIIDTDPGIDDSVAILLAFQSPEIDVIGLTSTFGNGDVDLTTQNCLLLCELAGKNIPVAKGIGKPLVIPNNPNPDFVHGKDGLGNTNWPAPITLPIEETAEDFIIRNVMDNPQEITLIALGPLTNLAKALLKEPKIASNVKEVIVFSGAVFYPGNCTPIAEANAWNDPHAADIVLTADWPLTMISLNASKKPQVTKEMFSRIQDKNPSIGSFLNQINQFYIDFYLSTDPTRKGANVHDSLTIVYLIDRNLFSVERGTIRVATDGLAIGATIFDQTNNPFYADWYNRPQVDVCIDCDADNVMELIESRLSTPNK